jgi:hypothetical protein
MDGGQAPEVAVVHLPEQRSRKVSNTLKFEEKINLLIFYNLKELTLAEPWKVMPRMVSLNPTLSSGRLAGSRPFNMFTITPLVINHR